MDEVGIDIQVLSLSFPGVEALDPGCDSLSKSINDELFTASRNTRIGLPFCCDCPQTGCSR